MANQPSNNIWDIPDIGNVELKTNRLVFRIEIKDDDKSSPYFFVTTFHRRDASRTLSNIKRSADQAGVKKSSINFLMSKISPIMGEIYSRAIDEETENTQNEEQHSPQPSEEMLIQAKKEAIRILGLQDPLEEISQRHLSQVVAGEIANSRRIFVKCVASRTKDKRVKWIVLIAGTSGAGKSTLMGLPKTLCRVKEIGRLTRHALDYTNLVGYDVLLLKEIGNMDKEDEGISTLKFLSVDDDGYTVEVPIRDPETGEMTTKTYKIPLINVISSSTRISFDEQFERRMELLNPDDSVAQTRRVKKFKAEFERQEIEIKIGSKKWRDREFSIEVLKAILNELDDIEVEIPFPDSLSRALSDDKIRVRGDIDKLSANVRLFHLLAQRTQEIIEWNGHRIILASPLGAVKVIELFREPFEAMISGIDKRIREIIEAMDALGYDANTTISMNQRSAIADKTRKNPKTIYSYMERLYQENKVTKGKEGEEKNSPVNYKLKGSPKDMLSSSVMSKERVGNDLYHAMWDEGMSFLLKQNLPKEMVDRIRNSWARSFLPSKRTQKRASNGKYSGIDRLISNQSTNSILNDKMDSNQGDSIDENGIGNHNHDNQEGLDFCVPINFGDGRSWFECIICGVSTQKPAEHCGQELDKIKEWIVGGRKSSSLQREAVLSVLKHISKRRDGSSAEFQIEHITRPLERIGFTKALAEKTFHDFVAAGLAHEVKAGFYKKI